MAVTRDDPVDADQTLRRDVALANRIIERVGLSKVFGHVSARIPGTDTFLLPTRRSPGLADEHNAARARFRRQGARGRRHAEQRAVDPCPRLRGATGTRRRGARASAGVRVPDADRATASHRAQPGRRVRRRRRRIRSHRAHPHARAGRSARGQPRRQRGGHDARARHHHRRRRRAHGDRRRMLPGRERRPAVAHARRSRRRRDAHPHVHARRGRARERPARSRHRRSRVGILRGEWSLRASRRWRPCAAPVRRISPRRRGSRPRVAPAFPARDRNRAYASAAGSPGRRALCSRRR